MVQFWARAFLVVCPLVATAGCDTDNILNRTASFGGATAGQRGQFGYVIINNTPFRALFTAGAYDDLDQNTVPQIEQFGDDAALQTLEGDSTSAIFQPNCARVFAIGTAELLAVVESNLSDADLDQDAMVPGVFFSSGELGTEEGAEPNEGVAPASEFRLGVDFACRSFLILRLEFDDVGPAPFRIDFEVIPSTDTRNPPL